MPLTNGAHPEGWPREKVERGSTQSYDILVKKGEKSANLKNWKKIVALQILT